MLNGNVERLWIFSKNAQKIYQTNVLGETLHSIDVDPGWQVSGICVTREEELLVCCKGDQTIKKCTKSGSLIDLINMAPLRPLAISTSWLTGEILVGAIDSSISDEDSFRSSTGRRVVFKYTSSGEKTTEIQFVSLGVPLFNIPWKIQVGTNGDIAVCNMKSEKEGELILLDKYGRLKFRYDSNVDDTKTKFCPVGICFDDKNNVVVSEAHSYSVQLLDTQGQFQGVLYRNRRYPPTDIVRCTNGDLMVGCSSGKVHILKSN
ncbi:uncharacterized protein LOC125647320 [Ostrea edulis]|uniref:uncharacterized protein LOC125647320 n=1 Tax=Ostrea edulis TaxID=37623 RepID=UPI0024AEA1C3|nr:uncharacterized protein LOC125647320 [Ostrea edulis]